ncbi:helix-turn-helix transcriptional regulator [Catenulispora pinisilvae]|uniref:helix-turn-helix transcriptional regulator n=1 Tax=Catenulispora pinisilvae TaxID=2705253 RepID=UPI001891D182|nr:helix-turn-helix transcriptional regulator [Catenulispora pinisilvae]
MALRVNAAAQRRSNAIQSQLLAARETTGLSRESLSEVLEVSNRTLRDWERRYESPSFTNLLRWAHELGFRLAIVDRQGGPEPPCPTPEDGAPWEVQEIRRLAPPLKSRRLARKISQTDLGLIIGVSRSSLQRWEDGEQLPRLIALIVWADRLDLTVELHPLVEHG